MYIITKLYNYTSAQFSNNIANDRRMHIIVCQDYTPTYHLTRILSIKLSGNYNFILKAKNMRVLMVNIKTA